DSRLLRRSRHDLVRGAWNAHAGGKRMKLLILRIAQDQFVIGVPENEGLGDILDRVLEAQFRLLVEAIGILLGGYVDGDADQVGRRLAGRAREGRPDPEPYPMTVGMADAEFLVERVALAAQKLLNHTLEWRVIGMDTLGNFAEAQKLTLLLCPDDRIHGFRPEYLAMCDVPV